MKTLLCLLALCLMLSTGAVAQRSMTWGETKNSIWGDPKEMDDYEVHAYFKNTLATPMQCVLGEVSRDFKDSDFISVCWDVCYTEDKPGRIYPKISVDAEAICNNLVCHFIPGPSLGVRRASYLVTNDLNTDTLIADFTFFVTPTGVKKSVRVSSNSFSAYPNPASASTTVQYAFAGQTKDANITLYNMLGREMLTMPVEDNNGTVQLNLKNLTPGVYFYALEVNGKKVATKRLVVAH